MANILVVGSANMDVIASLSRLPHPGETILIENIRLANGGKGANAAVAAARLGANARFLGAVGEDAFGAALRRGLENNGVDCRWLQTAAGSSGTAIILLNQITGQNSILVGPGANFCFTLPPTDEAFHWADAVMLQLEIPLSIAQEAAARAKKAGKLVVLDPAPAQADLPAEFLRLCDVISPNESELAILTGQAIDSPSAAKAAAVSLLARSGGRVVVKMAEKGSLWCEQQTCRHYPAFAVKAIDTTAAGDAFTAALTLGLCAGKTPAESMRLALAAGALTCTRLGAQPSLPHRAEVENFLASQTEYNFS